MFLKTLTLKGFKSFAEATKLELQPGLTVVVGPNGSGKSNVVDAVAWVLGAQGPRALRSSRMEDVIFAGSGNRPALGRAEVSLTIDNSAGLLPVELPEVTVTRTLFRNGDSEYAINGGPCRLLDVQELLSDAGVGRQQHVIVSQGHLDAVLESRPEGRRILIEEAAGVHKYRRRREKAERRLQATEEDLVRLQDLLKELRRQLRSLERQAGAARRQQALSEERTALRRHLLGRDAVSLRLQLSSAGRAKAEHGARRSLLEQALAGLDAEVAGAESPVATPAQDLDDVVMGFERLRGRARGLAGLLDERRRRIEGQLDDDLDDRMAALESERASLEADLHAVDARAAELGPRADELAAAERAVTVERQAFEEGRQEELPYPGGRAGEVRGELVALRDAVARSGAELHRADEQIRALEQREAELSAELSRLGPEMADDERHRTSTAAASEAGEERCAGARAKVEELRAELGSARQDQRVWTARAEALASFLESGGPDAGRPSGVEGILGFLLELVEVDQGWELAFEAAMGQTASAMVLDGPETARRALLRAREDHVGATMLALGIDHPASPEPCTAGSLDRRPAVRSHVRSATPGVEALLDTLLARVVVVDRWEEGLELALGEPGTVAVTIEGDRFAADGWRVGPSAVPTRAGLEEARTRAREAGAAAARAEEALGPASAEAAEADAARAELAARRTALASRLLERADFQRNLEDERRTVITKRRGVQGHVVRENQRVRAEGARIAELEAQLPALAADEAARAERVRARQAARRRLEERVAAVSTLRTDLEVRASALEERRAMLTGRLAEVAKRLVAVAEQREAAAERRRRMQTAAAVNGRLALMVTGRLSLVESRLDALHEQRRQDQAAARVALEHLDGLRRRRAATSRELDEVRERGRQAELEEAGVRLRLDSTAEAVLRELGCQLDEVVAEPCPDLPPGTSPPARLDQLDAELRALGPVNALALDDHQALEERHSFIEGQLEDVRSARRELGKVVRAIDGEITDVFAAAFADVAENFSKLFISLFPGGTGQLRLTDPEDLLTTGIEVEARPSGKRVGKLSLLSGGERSLTALAFLFAVFRSRPSPFYLLDEVEAALDDVNLNRFLGLVDEFRDEAQLVVVSHQKRTMEAADCLYGVTMQPGGASVVVSERAGRTGADHTGGGRLGDDRVGVASR